jgi:four helix bundle protein
MAKRYRFSFKRLDVYRAAVEHVDWTCRVVQRLPKGPFVMVNQAVSASLSAVGNIAEASGPQKRPGEVEQHLRNAQGSTFESAAHLDAFASFGVIDDDEYNAEEERLARIGAMLTRLMQRQRRIRRRRKPPRTPRRGLGAAQSAPMNPPRSGEAGRAKRTPAVEPSRSEAPAGARRPPGVEPPQGGGEAAAAAEIEPRRRHPRP